MLVWNFGFAIGTVVITFALGLLVALVLNKEELKGRRIYRSLIILPYAMPVVAMYLVWRDMFNTDFGLLNRMLGTHINWFGTTASAMFAILLVQLWLGYNYMFLVCTGALQSISADLTEAAQVDGAKPSYAFRTITFPLLLVALAPLLIASFAFNFNNFNAIYLVSQGAPFPPDNPQAGNTDILITYTYRLAFGGAGGAVRPRGGHLGLHLPDRRGHLDLELPSDARAGGDQLMSELIPPSETMEPTPLRPPGEQVDDTPHDVVRLGSARGGWFRRVGWRHLVGVLALAFSIFPILFVVSAALNPLGTLSSSQLIPTGASFENFTKLFDTSFPRWFLNTMILGIASAAVSLFISACAAYAFSRFRFKGRRFGLLSILLVQMFPQFLAIVALYLMFATITDLWPPIGFNTVWGLLLLYMGGALGVNTWLMKGFFDTIPKDLDESAKVDGASHAQIFFGIILPLVAPILAVTGLLGFIGAVNEFLIASIFLTQDSAKTAAVGLYGLVSQERNNNFGVFAAGTLILAIPTVALFQFLQRYIVGGLTGGAVKG